MDVLRDEPADERADRERERGDADPDADRAPALPGREGAVMIDSVDGFISAAPRPCTTRATISMRALAASPQNSDASVKTASPTTKMRRRPRGRRACRPSA